MLDINCVAVPNDAKLKMLKKQRKAEYRGVAFSTNKPIEYSGELYSEEHKRKFMAKDVKAKVFSETTVSFYYIEKQIPH